jgi:glycosyltransferase involved in cell wall biosynthesis
MNGSPLFSILTPVYNTPLDVLRQTIASVLAQECDDWEWILVDDCSTDPRVPALIQEHADQDTRIRLIRRETNGHIVAASNDALAAAEGEFVALLDHDDLLTKDALARNQRAIQAYEDVDFLYSDEDKVDDAGEFYDDFHKPTWSPERLRGQMYTSHLTVYRTAAVREVGGFRTGFDGSQDHDLALRVGEIARRVVHIPEVLYHWRAVAGSAAADDGAKPYATLAGQRAVQDHVDRVGITARVEQGKEPGRYRIERDIDPGVRISVIIPTIGQSAVIFGQERVMVVEAVGSVLARTTHDNVEIVVVYDLPTPASVLDELRVVAGDKLVLVPFERPFNYSEKMNVGVVRSTGDWLVFLNDDVEVISDRWLENLAGPLAQEDVGLTGAKLYFTDSTIQHAGHAYWGGGYHHPYRFWTADESGPFGELVVNREVSGVTAACAAMRRDLFFDVGGFTEVLPSSFNDVDLCYKVIGSGHTIVWVANCELFHFESRTRDNAVELWERVTVAGRWGLPTFDQYSPDPQGVPLVDPKTLIGRTIVTNDAQHHARRRPSRARKQQSVGAESSASR